MKTANRTLLAVLFVFLVTGLAFGQGMKLPRAIPQDAQLVAQDGDVFYYRIPDDSEASQYLPGDVQSAMAQEMENSEDPVLMFDVLVGPTDSSIFWYFKIGEEVVHELEFYLFNDATVTTKWVVSGPQTWRYTSTQPNLAKGHYYVLMIHKNKSYKKTGKYLFKGFALATGATATKWNTDTFKFLVVP
jgi:hypothetical protein